MEDKKMNEKESLELIAQMIQNSKKNLQVGSGNIFLLWGYLSAITSLLIYALILWTGNYLWNILWAVIPAVGYPVMYWLQKNEDSHVSTYMDKLLVAIWKTVGVAGISIAFMSSIYFQRMELMIPLVLIICALGCSISGSILNDKWMYNGGGTSLSLGIVMLYHTINPPEINLNYIAFAVCFIVMFVIPGYRLNKGAKQNFKTCLKN